MTSTSSTGRVPVPGESGPDLWNIVLAAGDGTRLAPLVRRLHGDDRPKQFAVLRGQRSLLQETLHRMRAVAPVERTVVVVPEAHRELARRQLGGELGPRLVTQPANLGTAPGILLPLCQVLARAPEATVIITPSDHHFDRPGRFTSKLSYAASAAAASPDGICLLAVEAEGPSSDLGWIMPGAPLPDRPGASTIDRFVEKPRPERARRLFEEGGLWNTFVMVGRAAAFWDLSARCLPRHVQLFGEYLAMVGRGFEALALHTAYARMAPADFSREVLARARGLGVVSVSRSGWSDWGTPERLLESLAAGADLEHLRHRLATPGAEATAEKAELRP